MIGQDQPHPRIQPPTVFLQREHGETDEGLVNERDSDLEYEDINDSRITTLIEMGFNIEQIRNALQACDDDVNEALTLLLSST